MPASVVRVANAALTQVADSGAATRTYEYAYVVPAGAPPGGWTAQITGVEGTEGTVTDTRVGGFVVLPNMPALRVTKTVDVLSDPVNGAVESTPDSGQRAAVPRDGREHAASGTVDASTLVIADFVPANTELVVAGGPARAVLRRHGAERLDVQLRDARDVLEPARRRAAVHVRARARTATVWIRTSRRCASRRAARCPAPLSGNNPSFSVEFRVRVR